MLYIDVFVSHFNAEQLYLENPKVHELAVAITAIATKKGMDQKWGAETLNALLYRFTAAIPGQLTTLQILLATVSLQATDWLLDRNTPVLTTTGPVSCALPFPPVPHAH